MDRGEACTASSKACATSRTISSRVLLERAGAHGAGRHVAPAIEMQKFFRAAAWPISLAAMISPRGWLAAVFLAALSAPAAAEEVCGTAIEVPAAETRALAPFAERLGLKYPRAAVGTISHVHATGRLPDCYLTKRAAEERGWHPGADLWRRAPGHSIGGDSFGNREGCTAT